MATRQQYRKMTREELYELAQERDIEGRSHLHKDELVEALEREDLGPDAVKLLTRQHDEIRRLFGEFQQLSDRASQRKQDLVREMITTLVKHAEVEEQVFYPAVRDEMSSAGRELDENLEEHHAAELVMAELDVMGMAAPRFDAKVSVLIATMTHHMDEEEQDLFPRVEEAIPEDRRRELGAAMEKVWRVAPTRPHPRTPDTPPGNILAALPATVLDLGVGAVRGVGRLVRRG